MAFSYPNGNSGITVNGRDLSDFSCKLQSAYTMGACLVETDLFQGKNQGTVMLLDQTYGTMQIILPLEFWGADRADTVRKWSEFCRTVTGRVELDLGDGFQYGCAVTDLGSPVFITDGWLAADVTLRGMRHKPEVVISPETALTETIFCESTFPRTDCVVRLPGTLLAGASQASVLLGGNYWSLSTAFTGTEDLILDGIHKIYRLGDGNITARMDWEEFPYLTPGDNVLRVRVDGAAVTQGVEIRYRPTYL